MRHRLRFATTLICMLMALSCAFAPVALAEGETTSVTVADLAAVDISLEGKTVSFTAEAVGDILNADAGHKWVNLTDGTSTVPVYITDEDAEKVQNLGEYSTEGSRLQVVGVYHTKCERGHQGELDVHASQVRLTDTGGPVTRDLVDNAYLGGALVLIAIGAALFLVVRIIRNRTS